MRVQHNIAAINNYRNISNSNTELNKSLQKLSSGYQINSASDNAAGLAISEKMRAQITGLNQANENIEDGISLAKVAESGLSSIHTPNLSRMRELAVQAANDTLTTDERILIQREIDEIKKGINSIANETEFNGIQLLNREKFAGYYEVSGGGEYIKNKYLALNVTPQGSFDLRTNLGYPTTENDDNSILIYGQGVGTTQPQLVLNNTSYNLKEYVSQPTTLGNGVFKTTYTIQGVQVTQSVRIIEDKYEFKYDIENKSGTDQSIGFYFHMDTMLGNDDRAPFIVDGTELSTEQSYSGSDLPGKFEVYNGAGNPDIKVQGMIKGEGIIQEPSELRIGQYADLYNAIGWTDTDQQVGDSGYALVWNEQTISTDASFSVNTFYGLAVPPQLTESVWTPSTVDPDAIYLQVGPNEENIFEVVLSDVRTKMLGIEELDVLTVANANRAITAIDKAADIISQERIRFGTYHNSLEYISLNVLNKHLNLSDAESKLRDLDIAKQSMKLAKDQVLLQSAQSLTAQVNNMAQGILEILG